jgi:hypothetical protein
VLTGGATGPGETVGTEGEAGQTIQVSDLTPFTALPRRVGFVRGHLWRERLCTFAIFSLLPTAFFWVYYVFSLYPHISPVYAGLRVAAPITSLWITFGALLMQQGDFNLEKLIRAFNSDGPQAGWDFGDIQRSIGRARRIYYWVAVPLAIIPAVAIGFAYRTLSSAIPLNLYSEAGGIFDLLMTGFISASGIWGVYTALSVVRGAVRRALITWRPFRSERAHGVIALYSFVWSTAVIFSTGSVFLPALLVLRARFGAVPGTVVLLFVVVLFAGGLVLFSVPAFMLYTMARQQQARTLDALAPVIEKNISLLEATDQSAFSIFSVHYSLDTALRVRAAIAAQDPAPVFNTMARAATTLVLPLFLTFIQVAVMFIH